MSTDTFIPLSLADIDAAYLTSSFRNAGVLASGQVSRFDSRVIGEGAGFMGEVVDLLVHFSPDSNLEPLPFILKIPPASKNRQVGQTLGVFEREIRFYRELQPLMKVRTPRHFHSAMDTVIDPETGLKALRLMDRMPLWLIRMMLPALNWANSKSERHYVLIIEHLKDHRVGDQVAGCSIEESRRVLTAMARMHAQFTGSPELDSYKWLVPMRYAAKPLHMLYLQTVDRFEAAYRDVLTTHAQELLEWLKVNFLPLMAALADRPQTIIHGDFRLDNLGFDDETGEIVLFDWQTVGIGAGAIDLAYFLSAAVTEDMPASTVDDLIGHYRQALADCGVDVPAKTLKWEYQVCLLTMLHRLVPAEFQDLLDLGEGRGNDLLRTWMERVMVHIRGIDPDELMRTVP